MKETKYTVAAFYKFRSLTNLELYQDDFLNFLQDQNIKGTVLLALEGINGIVAGSSEAIEKFSNIPPG